MKPFTQYCHKARTFNAFATQSDVQPPAVTLACSIGFTTYSTCVHRQQMDESAPSG